MFSGMTKERNNNNNHPLKPPFHTHTHTQTEQMIVSLDGAPVHSLLFGNVLLHGCVCVHSRIFFSPSSSSKWQWPVTSQNKGTKTSDKTQHFALYSSYRYQRQQTTKNWSSLSETNFFSFFPSLYVCVCVFCFVLFCVFFWSRRLYYYFCIHPLKNERNVSCLSEDTMKRQPSVFCCLRAMMVVGRNRLFRDCKILTYVCTPIMHITPIYMFCSWPPPKKPSLFPRKPPTRARVTRNQPPSSIYSVYYYYFYYILTKYTKKIMYVLFLYDSTPM